MKVTIYDDVDALLADVEDNNLDAGLVLQDGFDAAVRSGDAPELQLYIGGESLASDRIVIQVTALDLIRGVSGTAHRLPSKSSPSVRPGSTSVCACCRWW